MVEERLKKTGVPGMAELAKAPGFPGPAAWEKGPVAFIECIEEIPCNPCEAACPHGAIRVGEPITGLPVLQAEKCKGCGLCIPQCPGLAIYVKDYTHSPGEASIAFPYEYYPLPEAGQIVELVDREGSVVCPGRVLEVHNPARNRQTPVIKAAYPKEFFLQVVSMKRLPLE